ncbi:MAG: hypothetical protein V1495_10085 [Pseudomonadota bacterium]
MSESREGSTGRLLQLCGGYFFFYVLTGVIVKYFLGSVDKGFPGMQELEFLVYNSSTATTTVLLFVVIAGWYRLKSNGSIEWKGLRFPAEYLYIIPSGVCTAVIIPTTTLMYTLPISVMVAMVIMRGAVIVISRVVDAVQIRQGVLKKQVYWEENAAVVFAIAAVGVNLFGSSKPGTFDFIHSPAAMTILLSYIVAYTLRIYIMNYFKNTRAPGVKQDNKGFLAIEQCSAFGTLLVASLLVFFAPSLFGWNPPQIQVFRGAILEPRPMWGWAMVCGIPYATVTFFSVFIFMFKGRTATFAGCVNRLTSLVAGTTATLIFHYAFGGKFPSRDDWLSLGFILVAIVFLTLAEQRRAKELA